MDKRSLAILERAFAADIDGPMDRFPFGVIQTKSKLAAKLADDGYLERVCMTLPGPFPVILEGYRITLLGNRAYCMSDLCALSAEEQGGQS